MNQKRNLSTGSFVSLHGHTGSANGKTWCSKTYAAWNAAKNRCTNPRNKSWASYGGRGIFMCPRWLESFENFLADMGECPVGLTLERRNNSLGYSPGNCQWATRVAQANNRRNSVFLEFNGERLTIADWARRFGFGWHVIPLRLKLGWSVERTLTTPKRRHGDHGDVLPDCLARFTGVE
jgi:hypothetical protein